MRKLAKKHGLDTSADIDFLIDDLAKATVVTPLTAKRLKGGPAALRNKALHAKWEEYDIRAVGEAIRTTREIIQTVL